MVRNILGEMTDRQAAYLWGQINAKFCITEARERYQFVRDLTSLKLQDGDYFAC